MLLCPLRNILKPPQPSPRSAVSCRNKVLLSQVTQHAFNRWSMWTAVVLRVHVLKNLTGTNSSLSITTQSLRQVQVYKCLKSQYWFETDSAWHISRPCCWTNVLNVWRVSIVKHFFTDVGIQTDLLEWSNIQAPKVFFLTDCGIVIFFPALPCPVMQPDPVPVFWLTHSHTYSPLFLPSLLCCLLWVS